MRTHYPAPPVKGEPIRGSLADLLAEIIAILRSQQVIAGPNTHVLQTANGTHVWCDVATSVSRSGEKPGCYELEKLWFDDPYVYAEFYNLFYMRSDRFYVNDSPDGKAIYCFEPEFNEGDTDDETGVATARYVICLKFDEKTGETPELEAVRLDELAEKSENLAVGYVPIVGVEVVKTPGATTATGTEPDTITASVYCDFRKSVRDAAWEI